MCCTMKKNSTKSILLRLGVECRLGAAAAVAGAAASGSGKSGGASRLVSLVLGVLIVVIVMSIMDWNVLVVPEASPSRATLVVDEKEDSTHRVSTTRPTVAIATTTVPSALSILTIEQEETDRDVRIDDDDNSSNIDLEHVDDDVKHSSNINVESVASYDFPTEPFLQTEAMVKEAIGPAILNDEEQNPLRNCSVTTQFRLLIPSNDDPSSMEEPSQRQPWIIQSFHGNGIPKTYGGDEIYVEWLANAYYSDKENSTVDDNDVDLTRTVMGVALVHDQGDGTYVLDFVTPPILQAAAAPSNTPQTLDVTSKLGRLTLYYDYTCDIGSFVSPIKDEYARAGEVHVSFDHDAVPRPPIRDFDVPNADGAIDLSRYDQVIGFGDSIMMQLVKRYKANLYWHPNLYFEANVNQALSDPAETATMLEKLRDFHGARFEAASSSNQSIAVIAGSATWDVMRGRVRPGLEAHLTACRTFLQQAMVEYPHVDFYWKSPSAIVLHRRGPLSEIGDSVWLSRSRYISDSVPRQVYHAQKELMAELGVPLLDLFDAYYLSAPWSLKGDSRHYQDRISSLLLSYYWPGLNRNGAFVNKERKR